MIKRFLVLTGAVSLLSTALLADIVPLAPMSPENYELDYDMHETIVTMNIRNMWDIFRKEVGYKKLFGMLGRFKTYKLLSGIARLKLRTEGATFEEYKILIEAYDPKLVPIAERMAASYDVMPGMQELIEELYTLGYRQRVATNGGLTDYTNLAKKYPDLFKYFEKPLVVDATKKPVVRKPTIAYYNNHFTQFDPERKRTVIFIDDKRKNIEGARKAGMIGIHFKNGKQLREDLKKLGIPLK